MEYGDQLDKVRFGRWFLAFFVIVWPVYWMLIDVIQARYPGRAGGYRAMTTGYPVLDAFFMTLLAGVLLGMVAVKVRRYLLRRKFLRQILSTSIASMRAA